MTYGIIFLIGIIFGSFFNVVGLRVPNRESIVKPRSTCSFCKGQLTVIELIPIFSYLFQKGRCKNCQVKISPFYPLIELLTGLLFCLAFFLTGWGSETLIALFVISLLIIVLVSDMTYMMIPDQVLIFFTILFIISRFFIPLEPWWDSFAGAIVGFGLPFFIAVLSQGGLGGGDIKLFGVIGLVMGVKGVIVTFFFSCLVGAIIGMSLGFAGKVKKGKPIPFGPFIGVGTLCAYFGGESLLILYLQFL